MGTRTPSPRNTVLACVLAVQRRQQLATSGYSGLLTLWNLEEGKAAASKKIKFGAYCVAFAPDGQSLVTGHDNHMIYITPLAELGK